MVQGGRAQILEGSLALGPPLPPRQSTGRSGGSKPGAQGQLTTGRIRLMENQGEPLSEHTRDNERRGWCSLLVSSVPTSQALCARFACIIITSSQTIIKWILRLEN